jgi:hypothetical protein
MARTKNPATATARSAADTASDPATATAARPADDSPTAAVLAALSAESGGATVAVIAEHAGIIAAAARQALLAQEKAGAAIRVKGSRPGLPDTWKPAAEPALAAEAPDAGSAPGEQFAPASAGDAAEGETGKASAEPGPDPAVTAEAAGNVLAIARDQAADEVGKALAAGDLPAALTALATARDQAAHGRRVIKAASGRRAPATRPGALRDLVEEHLRKFPDAAFTPHQVGKVLTRSAGAVANALDKLVSLGIAQMVTEKPRSYRLAPAALTPATDTDDPGVGAAATPSAA